MMFSQKTYLENESSLSKSTLPCENQNSLMVGLLAHFGPPFAFIFLVEMSHFNLLLTLLSFLFVSTLSLIFFLSVEKLAPSVDLNPPQRMDTIKGLIFVFFQCVGIGWMIVSLSWWVSRYIFPQYSFSIWLSILATIMIADFTYYFIHRFLNHSRVNRKIARWYRGNHVVHHSVKALDFLRGNHSSMFDGAICSFQIQTGIVSSLLGLSLAQAFSAYVLVLLLQSTHHVNYTFNIGWLRYIFVDNHSHKLHHCPKGNLVNFGAVFSLCDRFFGTYYENWNVSSNYMEKNRIALPITKCRS